MALTNGTHEKAVSYVAAASGSSQRPNFSQVDFGTGPSYKSNGVLRYSDRGSPPKYEEAIQQAQHIQPPKSSGLIFQRITQLFCQILNAETVAQN